MADNRNDEPRGSSWNDRDRWRGEDRGSSDAERARPGWGSLEDRPRGNRFEDDDRGRHEGGFFERAGQQVRSWLGDDDDDRSDRDRSRRNWDHGASGVRRDFQRGRAQSWRDPPQQRGSWEGSGAATTGRHLGYDDMSGMMGGFGNQRFGSSQDDHYLTWRNRQLEQLDRDYQDYCREREQQFHQNFDSWRSSRQSGQSGGGTVASGQGESTDALTSTTPASAGSSSFIGGGGDPSAATAGGGGDPTPEPMAPGGSRKRS